jgi:hypothetical protein
MTLARGDLQQAKSLLSLLYFAFSHCALDIRCFLQHLLLLNLAILKSLMPASLGSGVPRTICFEPPVTFQDAGGNYFPVNIQLIDSWEAGVQASENHSYASY